LSSGHACIFCTWAPLLDSANIATEPPWTSAANPAITCSMQLAQTAKLNPSKHKLHMAPVPTIPVKAPINQPQGLSTVIDAYRGYRASGFLFCATLGKPVVPSGHTTRESGILSGWLKELVSGEFSPDELGDLDGWIARICIPTDCCLHWEVRATAGYVHMKMKIRLGNPSISGVEVVRYRYRSWRYKRSGRHSEFVLLAATVRNAAGEL